MDKDTELTDEEAAALGLTNPESNPLEEALALEGVHPSVASIARGIYNQESGGGKNTETSNAGAVGGMQIKPDTFKEVADNDWDINDPVTNARAGVRYLNKLWNDYADQDEKLTRIGYYGGPGGIKKAKNGVAVKDPLNPNAPDTFEYAEQSKAKGEGMRELSDDEAAALGLPMLSGEESVPAEALPPVESAPVEASPTYRRKWSLFGDWSPESLTNSAKGVHRGVLDTVEAGGQMLLHAFGDEETANEYDKRVKDEIAKFEAENPGINAPRLFGNMLLPGGSAASLPKLALSGAAMATMSPVTEENDGFWKEKAQQAATGAVLAPVVNKIFQGKTRTLPQEVQEVQDLSKKYHVPLTTGDYNKSPYIKKVEKGLESVPFSGMPAFRENQNKAASKAASDFTKKFDEKLNITSYDDEARIINAASAGDKEAQETLDIMRLATNDPDQVIQASGRAKLMNGKLVARDLYDDVDRLAGQDEVKLPNTTKYLDKAIEELKKSRAPNTALVSKLSELRRGLDDQVTQTSSGAMSALTGVTPNTTTRVVDKTYGSTRQLRSDIGSMIRDARSGKNALVGEKEVGYLSKVKSNIERDLRDYINSSGNQQLQRAANIADEHYKLNVVPYKNPTVAKALSHASPDEISGQFIKPGKANRAGNFVGLLDSKGKAALQSKILNSAFESAFDERLGMFSPAKFSGYLDKHSAPVSQVFNRADRKDVSEISKLLKYSEESGRFLENPPTGNRLMPWSIAGGLGALGGLKALAAGIIGSRAATAMFTSPNGPEKFLSQMSRMPNGPLKTAMLLRLSSVTSGRGSSQ